MRPVVYGITVLAAVGIMIGIVMVPDSNVTDSTGSTNPVANVMSAPGTLKINVPDMHCAVMCYPKVKKALEAQENIASVELAEQKEEGIIDTPHVVINYRAGFNLNTALTSLEKNEFKNNELVQ